MSIKIYLFKIFSLLLQSHFKVTLHKMANSMNLSLPTQYWYALSDTGLSLINTSSMGMCLFFYSVHIVVRIQDVTRLTSDLITWEDISRQLIIKIRNICKWINITKCYRNPCLGFIKRVEGVLEFLISHPLLVIWITIKRKQFKRNNVIISI